jgi:hypothetical protein
VDNWVNLMMVVDSGVKVYLDNRQISYADWSGNVTGLVGWDRNRTKVSRG